MPYIKKERRKAINGDSTKDYDSNIKNAGELNYYITTIIKYYWNSSPCYQTINDITGALEGAKLEFYRRIAIPYENKKIKANGDVYD